MGNCIKQNRPPPTKSYEEHVVKKHQLRMGVQFEKSPQGDIHIGLKGGLENTQDTIVKCKDCGEDECDGCENEVNKIPRAMDLVNREDFEQ